MFTPHEGIHRCYSYSKHSDKGYRILKFVLGNDLLAGNTHLVKGESNLVIFSSEGITSSTVEIAIRISYEGNSW